MTLRDYLKDRQSEATADEQIPGRGVIDFPKILKTLKDVGYDKAINLVIIGAFTYPLSRQMGIAERQKATLIDVFRN